LFLQVESILLWQIASALTTPVGSARVAPPGGTGSQPFPQAAVVEREENAGNPIGGEVALVQTGVTAQVTAALTAIRLFSRPVSSGAQGSAALPQATEVEEAKQAAGDPIGNEAAIARAKATAMNAAAANASAKAAAAQASAATEKVQAQATQVQKQTKPEVPLELVAEKVQPEVQPEPTAKENVPAVTADTAALIRGM
jgi:hypothetical protein